MTGAGEAAVLKEQWIKILEGAIEIGPSGFAKGYLE
jgi:hypothetical protein